MNTTTTISLSGVSHWFNSSSNISYSYDYTPRLLTDAEINGWDSLLVGDNVGDLKDLYMLLSGNGGLYASFLYDSDEAFKKDFPIEDFRKDKKWHYKDNDSAYAYPKYIPIVLNLPRPIGRKHMALSFTPLEGINNFIPLDIRNNIYMIDLQYLFMLAAAPIKHSYGLIKCSRERTMSQVHNEIKTIMETFLKGRNKELLASPVPLINVVGDTIGFLSIDDKIMNLVKALYDDVYCIKLSLKRGFGKFQLKRGFNINRLLFGIPGTYTIPNTTISPYTTSATNTWTTTTFGSSNNTYTNADNWITYPITP